jgi:hypothetical protein
VWEAPAFNGNSDILCYKVDYKVADDDIKWSNAAYTIQECCLIKSLKPRTKYRFRVSCINSIGVSAFSWASEEVTTADSSESSDKLVIDYALVESLLDQQYNLEKRGIQQQLVLIKKQEETVSKRVEGEQLKILTNQNPMDLYTMENKWLTRGGEMGFTIGEAKDVTHGSKRMLKVSKSLNDNEIKILRELKEQDRLVQLDEVFDYQGKYTYVYTHALPILEFVSFKHKYSEECVVKILRQLLDGIQWLHLHGFVHLNIHPLSVFNSNLTQVNVKLGGFENALQLDTSMRRIDTNRVLQTLPVEFACKLNFYYVLLSLK